MVIGWPKPTISSSTLPAYSPFPRPIAKKKDEDFHSRLIEHTSEEKGHEILALKDLQALGFQLSDFQESPATSAFYQTQYYQIQHIDPLAFFGYILCLEGLAVEAGQHIYDQAKSSYGAQCSRFLKIHVGEDPEHLTKAFQSIENLSATRLKNIETSLKLSFSLYGGIIRSLETSNQHSKMSPKVKNSRPPFFDL